MVLECDTCNGTEFETIDGYAYCQECGTQSQQQQVEMEAELVLVGDRTIAEIVNLKINKHEDTRITSWEEYNYILVGLVEELIGLGANNRFKKCVLRLWTRYLQVIEAAFFSLDDECLPRLPANYNKRDAEILYNKHHRKRARKRRASSCSSVSSTETKDSTGKADSVIKSFKVSKIIKMTKAALARAQYEDYKKLDNDSSSVATSLATGSTDKKSNNSLNLTFTRNARRTMKRNMHKKHIAKHESDYEDAMDCHQKRSLPKHKDKVENLDNGVIIAILYLALNLSEDEMQCSDLIRFLREGHVSYADVQNFIPDNVKVEGNRNFEYLQKRAVFNHASVRCIASKLLRDMSIPDLILPDMAKLTQRYIDELQLPEELKFYVENFIAYHPPVMACNPTGKPSFYTPNYEARAMSYIILVMKMLFGLDDDRETKISGSARRINGLLPENPELHLFVVDDWLKMLNVRKLTIEKHHMPSAIRQPWMEPKDRRLGEWELYVDHIKTMYESKQSEQNRIKSDTNRIGVANNTMMMLHGMSQKQGQRQRNRTSRGGQHLINKSYNFKASVTPFKDYIQTLLQDNSKMSPLISRASEVYLKQEFSLTSLQVFYGDRLSTDRLKETLSGKGLKLIVEELSLNSRALNIVNSDRFCDVPDARGMVKVEIVSEEEDQRIAKNAGSRRAVISEIRPAIKAERRKPLEKDEVLLNISNMDFWVNYISYEKSKRPFATEGYTEHLKDLPNNFKFLLFECARMVEQDPRYLLFEMHLMERTIFYERKGINQPKGYVYPPPKHFW